jgi:RNA polymerase sigma-70 factor, ECF subfamily
MELLDDKTHTQVASIPGMLPAARPAASEAQDGELEPFSTNSGRLSDETLMAHVARGDPHSFALLYERHVHGAAALATNMCRRRVIAEEVIQEAFLALWRSRQRYDPARGSVRAWILGIVRNRAIDSLRQSVAHELAEVSDRALEGTHAAGELTDSEFNARERGREILAALDGLPPEQSRVITLAYYGGYTHTEIATMLNTPIGTVKGRMRLGLRKMAGSIPVPG